LTIADENEAVMGNDVGARRRSMEFSFHNHLPMLQMRMVRCAIRRRSSETILRQRFHDGENVMQARREVA
jgi:hypothetical protein